MTLVASIAAAALAAALVVFIMLRLSGGADRRPRSRERKEKRAPRRAAPEPLHEGRRGDPRVCPVCAVLFERGETVASKIFPPTAKNERLLHITGCPHCLNGGRRRLCPVCGAELALDEYLSARVYPQRGRPHVHVVGCTHCSRGRG